MTKSPSIKSHRLPVQFTLNVCMRLGCLPMSLDGSPQRHTCGGCGQPLPADADEQIAHAMSCKKINPREGNIRHFGTETVASQLLRNSGAVAVTRNQSFEIVDSKGQRKFLRPDLESFTGDNRTPTLYDISVTHPSCITYRAEASVNPRSAARNRERYKISKYSPLCLNGRRRIVPLVMETYGALGPDLERFIRFHSTLISRANGRSYHVVVYENFANFSFALQRGNYAMIAKCIYHVSI